MMEIIKREVTTFPPTPDGQKCAELYFEHIKKTGVTPCDLKVDTQGYHVAGGYVLTIDERKLMEQENKKETNNE